MSKLVKFFIGALTGAVVGGITALLLAPKTGYEFRREIQTDIEEWIKEVESTMSGSYILLEGKQEKES